MKIIKLILLAIIFSQVSFAKSSESYEILDIEFIDHLPFINIKVEGNSAKVLIDTGARNKYLVLSESILAKLSTTKQFPTKEKSSDITGKEYIATEYVLPQFNIGSIPFIQTRVSQDTNWGLSEGGAKSPLTTKDGVIGLALFINKAIIIDYPNKKFVIIDGKYPPQYDIDNWNDIAFKVDRYGLSFFLNIDNNKTKRFILDSGANITLIKQSAAGISEIKNDCMFSLMNYNCRYIKSETLKLKDLELPNLQMFIFDFPRDFEPDGILGYNFLEDKVLYIDFNKRIMKMK